MQVTKLRLKMHKFQPQVDTGHVASLYRQNSAAASLNSRFESHMKIQGAMVPDAEALLEAALQQRDADGVQELMNQLYPKATTALTQAHLDVLEQIKTAEREVTDEQQDSDEGEGQQPRPRQQQTMKRNGMEWIVSERTLAIYNERCQCQCQCPVRCTGSRNNP
eukprot:COSAG02_NODE_28_length_51367_cov_70.053932_33_plen_164_part_00